MRLPRLILAVAVLVGIAADVLLRRGFVGIAFPVWIAVVAVAALLLARQSDRTVTREAYGWLLGAVVAAAGLAWRDASELQALDFFATLFSLGLGAIALGQPQAALIAGRLRDTVWAGARVLRDVFIGAIPLALRELVATSTHEVAGRRGWPVLRVALIVVVLAVVFGSLLSSADPIFASLVAIPAFDVETLFSHVIVAGFFAWVFAGWSRGAFISSATATRPPARLPFTLGMTDMTAALATLDVLFAVFILAQIGWLFGGEAFLQARTGLTAAEYARKGFFQMVFVVMLAVPLLMATRALLAPTSEAARRHTRLAIPMVVLLLAMIASAALRMRLYVQYFGLTTDRFYTLAIMTWLAFVLVWLGATMLRGRGQRFVAGAVLSGFATLLVLNVLVPDRVVARINVERAQRPTSTGGTPLDLAYLSTLSGEAMSTAIAATLTPPANLSGSTGSAPRGAQQLTPVAQRCHAARRIRSRWGPSSRAATQWDESGSWRQWNAGVRGAYELTARNTRALLAIEHDACAAVPGAGDRAGAVVR